MLARKHDLTKKEMAIIDIARKKYAEAFQSRENPSDFNSNLTVLRQLREACHLYTAVLFPHGKRMIEAEKKSQASSFGFFRDRASNEVLREVLIIEKIKSNLADPIHHIIKSELEKEPRITSLAYHQSYNEFRNKKNKLLDRTDIDTYKITFSDNSELIFNNLDSTSLDKVKSEFNAKMEALSSQNQIRLM